VTDNVYVLASGALARMRDLDVIANNLANLSTTGFRADRTLFESALESRLLGPDGRPQPGAPGRVFVGTAGTATEMEAGPIQRTGAPLDAAIRGPGFFAVQTRDGVAYTRAGSFQLDRVGQLTTVLGHPVLGDGGAIVSTGRPLRILESGDVVDDRGQLLGRLRVVRFDDPASLVKEGGNLFRAPAGVVPRPVDSPSLAPGSLEGSNVSAVAELARMVMVQRSFEATLRASMLDDQATERLLQEFSG